MSLFFPDQECTHVEKHVYKIVYKTGFAECPKETYYVCKACSKLPGMINENNIISKEVI